MYYFSSGNWDPDTFCITAPGFEGAQAYQLLPLKEEEPEGEQIVPLKKREKKEKKKLGVVKRLEDKGGSV